MGEGEALLRGVGIGNFWLSKSRGGGGGQSFSISHHEQEGHDGPRKCHRKKQHKIVEMQRLF